MSKTDTKRIKPSLLQTDRECLTALSSLAGYSPGTPGLGLNVLKTTCDELEEAHRVEAQAIAAAASARLKAISKEFEFHNLILGAKDQVVAQFGMDSNEAETLGIKKKRPAP